jgi:translocation and assembly module TamB
VLVGVAALLVALGGFLVWLLRSPGGAQWAVGTAEKLMDGKLSVTEVRGTLITPLSVHGVRYRDPEAGLDVSIASASVDLAFRELLARRVHVLDAEASGIAVSLSEPTKPQEEDGKPFSLDPPINLVVDRLSLQGAKVSKEGRPLFEATKALLVASWTGRGVGVRQLEVESPQGHIGIDGTVARGESYEGRANGRFRWQQGEYEYAGELVLTSSAGESKLDARLRSPLDARLQAAVKQERAVPWSFELNVPTFDPRAGLLPDSSIESLMLVLQGRGTRENAHVTGEVELNGAKVFADPIDIRLQDRVMRIEELALRDANHRGMLGVTGEVRFDREPFHADLNMKWRDVEVPERVAGQKLATHGQVAARGNLKRFETRGDLSVGPPGRLANVTLAANGTPEAIVLETLSIVQPRGHLTARGQIDLRPHIGWQMAAEAQRFDPGALLAGWPGSLGFQLDTEGELPEAGPRASLKLGSLAGTLRGRAIGGDADLALAPNKSVKGELNLKSGRSTVRVVGTGGEALDLTADFDVATLADWVPDARGQITGSVTVKGEWPKVAVKGGVQARGLTYEKMSVRSLDIEADIEEPRHPNGSLTASAIDATGPDFAFASVELQARGSEADHSARLQVNGEPASTDVSVKGQRLPNGWQGSVEALTLNVPGIETLTLRQPVRVRVAGKAFEVSEACLANPQAGACASAQQSEAGELLARYSIEHLPLALIATLAKPGAGYVVQGALEGKGDIRRTPQGALFGNATLSSASGSVAEEGDENDPLLSYEGFELTAQLEGETAHAATRVAFNEGGSVRGELAVTALGSAAPALNGRVELSIADLSPIGLFIPQLANVRGRANGEVTVAGTLAAPNVSGSAQAADFAAELPILGLQLEDGALKAGISGAGALSLEGHVTSGKGRLTFEGGGPSIDELTIRAEGKDVLAANIPAANVVVAPQLSLMRKDERMDLTGEVSVSSASIDLTKMPKGNNVTQASPDVVVVDDPAPEAAAAKAMQLYTHVTVVLGEGLQAQEMEKVKLVGFGLDARLAGQLDVSESLGSEPLGAGEVRLAGKYKAYGQDLTIQEGRLLYANTPLSDPQLDIVAVREVDDVTAKLSVNGSARSPILQVSADPSMPQTAALSYLVTGKPLDQLGSGEGDVVQSAAQSLGGAAGNFLAKNLGKRLGIDEIGVDNSSEIGGSAFTVGQYLSPRLYISYGVGIFEPGQVVTLRYRISRQVNLEASQGPKSQRAGINFKREK